MLRGDRGILARGEERPRRLDVLGGQDRRIAYRADLDKRAPCGRQDGGHERIRHEHVLDPKPALKHRLDAVLQIEDHLDRVLVRDDAHRGEHEDQNRPLQQHRQTARRHAHVLLAVKLQRLLVELFLVVGVFLLKRLQLGLDPHRGAHAAAGLDVQRQHQQAHEQRKHHNRPSVIAHPAVDPVEHGYKQGIDRVYHSQSSKGVIVNHTRKCPSAPARLSGPASRGHFSCAGRRPVATASRITARDRIRPCETGCSAGFAGRPSSRPSRRRTSSRPPAHTANRSE